MSGDNILSQVYRAYQKYVPSPLAQSAILGGLTVPALYLTNKLVYNRLKRLAQDPRAAAMAGLTPQEAQDSLQEFQSSTFGKHGLPWLAGLSVFALSAAPHVDFKQPWWGLNKWYPAGDAAAKVQQDTAAKAKQEQPKYDYADPQIVDQRGYRQNPHRDVIQYSQQLSEGMPKNEALAKVASLWGDQGYQPSFDFNTPLTQRSAVDLFANNPYIKQKDYERNLGTSIIMGAPAYGGHTTLGGVYDSAVNKFQKKLTLGGLAGSAVKGAVAGGLAGLFTDTLGAVVGMPDPLRRSVANTVGFANAMCSILT